MRSFISKIALAAVLSIAAVGLTACGGSPDDTDVRETLDHAAVNIHEHATAWKKTSQEPSLSNHQSRSVTLRFVGMSTQTIIVTRDRWGAHSVWFWDESAEVSVDLKDGGCQPKTSLTPDICTFLSADEWKDVYQTFYDFAKKNDPAVG